MPCGLRRARSLRSWPARPRNCARSCSASAARAARAVAHAHKSLQRRPLCTHAAAHAHAARLLTQRTRSHSASMAHATRVAGPDVAAATVAFFTRLAPSGLVAAPVVQVARPSRRPHCYGAQRPAGSTASTGSIHKPLLLRLPRCSRIAALRCARVDELVISSKPSNARQHDPELLADAMPLRRSQRDVQLL